MRMMLKSKIHRARVTDVNLEDVKKTAEAVKKLGAKSIAIGADITKKAEVDAMVKKAIDEYGKIDVLCNVAGAILHKDYVPLDEQKYETWSKQMTSTFSAPCMSRGPLFPT